MADIKKIGKIKGAHGLKGEVEVFVFSKDTSWAKKIKKVFLTKDESMTPVEHEVQSVRSKVEIVLLGLKSITDRTMAEKMIGNLVYIPAALLKSKKGETIFLSEIMNFKVIDGKNDIGEVVAFSSNGIQDLLVVKGEGHQSEIPFVEPFIDKIDHESKIIYMNLPEGLLTLDQENEKSQKLKKEKK